MINCPTCGSDRVSMSSTISPKIGGWIIETHALCNGCKFIGPEITLWSDEKITINSDVYIRGVCKASEMWNALKE